MKWKEKYELFERKWNKMKEKYQKLSKTVDKNGK